MGVMPRLDSSNFCEKKASLKFMATGYSYESCQTSFAVQIFLLQSCFVEVSSQGTQGKH